MAEPIEPVDTDASDAAAPFRLFVVKLHSRCNLSCAYCYVYHHADAGWIRQPVSMSAETMTHLARRIGEHVRQHSLSQIGLLLHGGEPLLAGAGRIDLLAATVRAELPGNVRLDIMMQTNGVLLDDTFLELFHRHGIRVGVSLDGDAVAHNRHRRFADGRGSRDLVLRGLAALCRPEHRPLYAGLLCTVDLANEPVTVYENLLRFEPPQIDLLLPHGNWVRLPPGRSADTRATPYADWLIPIFDRWYSASRRETGIRLFDSVIMLLLGGRSDTEAVGSDAAPAITIETDGSLEGTDALKSTAPGLARTGLTVRDNSFDEVRVLPMIRSQLRGRPALGPTCRKCPEVEICGGGLYAHRYGPEGGFANPSVYCPDLLRLIAHVRRRVVEDLAGRAARQQRYTGEVSG